MATPEVDHNPPLHCAAHPGTETYLRCAQCGTPICPRCIVMTPVGAKCAACARARPHPAFILTPVDVALVALAALVGAVALGVVASVLRLIPLVSLIVSMFFPFIAGLLLAEVVNRVARAKRATILRVFAGVGVVVAYLVFTIGDFLLRDPIGLFASGLLPTFLLRGLLDLITNPIDVLFLIVGVWIAWQRV